MNATGFSGITISNEPEDNFQARVLIQVPDSLDERDDVLGEESFDSQLAA
jgi:hypothetical protein